MVNNLGTLDLTLGTITLPGGYSLVANFGATTLQPGQTTSFIVQLDAVSAGSFVGAISFGNNDADENPFGFAASGTVTTPPPSAGSVMDDGDAGYSATAGWITYKGVGSGAEMASWTHGAGYPANIGSR